VGRTLLRLDPVRAVPPLVQYAFSSDDPCLYLLSEINECEAVLPGQVLRPIASKLETSLDRYPDIRAYGQCLFALGRTGDPEALPFIQRGLQSPHRPVYEGAAAGLVEYNGLGNVQIRLRRRLESEGFERLPAKDKLVWSILELARLDPSLGYDLRSYFHHESGDQFHHARRGLALIGASASAEVLDRVNALFGGQGPSRDLDSRISQMERMSTEVEEVLKQLQHEFCADPDKMLVRLYTHLIATGGIATYTSTTREGSKPSQS
jgi:hypothetical protein